ncbi:MAG: hypothetical protein Q9204_009290, partial [Flavoplaca sp. TL-2023a]
HYALHVAAAAISNPNTEYLNQTIPPVLSSLYFANRYHSKVDGVGQEVHFNLKLPKTRLHHHLKHYIQHKLRTHKDALRNHPQRQTNRRHRCSLQLYLPRRPSLLPPPPPQKTENPVPQAITARRENTKLVYGTHSKGAP